MNDDAEILNEAFLTRVAAGNLPDIPSDTLPQGIPLLELFKSQLLSRHLDMRSRILQKQGHSFYTIGSSGHEGTAAIASAFRPDDMAFLHYRDAAFFIQRANQVPNQQPMRDLLLSFVASANDPISGGRHKVLGSKALNIPPQTSTIASHLPKAVGAAASIGIAKSCEHAGELKDDGVILCSFGDASLNHSTAQGAMNSADWMAYQGIHLPIVFICEDNGIGISVGTPDGWVEASMQNRPAIEYMRCNGLNLVDTYQTAQRAATYARTRHKPVFLHMECVRLMGHAGSDIQSTYLPEDTITSMNARDPLLYSAQLLLTHHIATPDEIIALYHQIADEVKQEANYAIAQPKLDNAAAIMQSIIPPKRAILPPTKRPLDTSQHAKPLLMGRLLNLALHEIMSEHSHIIMAGEDIGKKGGVYGVTQKLQREFGMRRVIDTLLDEQSILGLSIGMAHNRLLPIVEIQFLAYVHNAEDQIRGEAATLSFFSQGQYTNPMMIRIAGLGYQKGFGGHFHNDNSIAALRDIPGVIIACPSNGANAVAMLRECVRLCEEEQRVVVFLEPVALYHMKDLHIDGDNGWLHSYKEARTQSIDYQQIQQYGNGTDLCIITYGNGVYLSSQAVHILQEQHGVSVSILDLCWLHPLPETAIKDAVAPHSHVLIVDECRKTGSLSESLMALLTENSIGAKRVERMCAEDSFIPLGVGATLTLPSKQGIIEAALSLLKG